MSYTNSNRRLILPSPPLGKKSTNVRSFNAESRIDSDFIDAVQGSALNFLPGKRLRTLLIF